MNHPEIVKQLGFKSLDFIPAKIRPAFQDASKSDHNKDTLASLIIKMVNRLMGAKIPYSDTRDELEDGKLYLLSKEEYPDNLDLEEKSDMNQLIFVNKNDEYFVLEFSGTKSSLRAATLVSIGLKELGDEEEVVDGDEESKEDDKAVDGDDESEEEEAADEEEGIGAGESKEDDESEEEEEEEEEEVMDITFHPNDQKNMNNLPIVKVMIEGEQKEFRVGYSNVLYSNSDKKPYGLLLTPIVQGRSVEIYVFEYK